MGYQNDSEKSKEKNDSSSVVSVVKQSYNFRRILSQVLATTVKLMLTFQFGLILSFSGIIIPALTGLSNEQNADEFLTLTGTQASWIGSILYIFEPIGSVLSAVATDRLGRRRAMMIVNVPITIAWLMMYQARSVLEIFIAISLLGFGVGLMEAPIMTYIGEICESSTRGILIAYTNLGTSLGGAIVYLLNTKMPWRTAGLVCMCVPITTLVMLYFIPETPHWLLSKNRIADAENALCWLRGWVPKKVVSEEFHDLKRFGEWSRSCEDCVKQNVKCSHPPASLAERLAEFKRRRTGKSFLIVIALFVIVQYSGVFAMTPYLVQIFKTYQSPFPPDQTTSILSILNVFATITFMCLVRYLGKRRLYLIVLSGVCLSSFIISCYGFVVLPKGINSFDRNSDFTLENPALAYIPIGCLIVWSFCSYCGILMMPWQLLAEIFSFKTRGLATGLSAAINYVMGFVTIKTYYNLETSFSMPGVSLFYFIFSLAGHIVLYKILPETENRTLEDIEMHFSDETKKITDWQIPIQRDRESRNKF